mgnify:CR=1 FL=1
MQELTIAQIEEVSGGSDREDSQFVAAMFAGAATGGNGFVMGVAGWLMGQYYDFQGDLNVNGPSGPSSNHLTTSQYRQTRRE